MLFLFRSAPEVEKRIHSKLFRNFLEEPGYKRAGLHYCITPCWPQSRTFSPPHVQDWLSPTEYLIFYMKKNWIIPSSNLHADKAKPDKVTTVLPKILPFLILHLECTACPAPLPSFCSPGFGLQLCTNCKQGNLN